MAKAPVLQRPCVVGSTAVELNAPGWPSVAAQLVQIEAHMPGLRTRQPLVGRWDQQPEADVAQWAGPSVCVVAAGSYLGLAQEAVLAMPPPEFGSAKGAGRPGEEHLQHTQPGATTAVPDPESGQAQMIDLVVEQGPHRLESW